MYSLIPNPKKAEFSDKTVILPATLFVCSGGEDPADTLICFAERTHGIRFGQTEEEAAAGVILAEEKSLSPESFCICITEKNAKIVASDGVGLQNGVSALVQLMRPGEGGVLLPLGHVEDAPDSTWRGVMIDLARDWHPFEFLLEYVDLCRFYRLSCLHLHFTDDQSYTLPSRAFPRLSTKGRSYTEAQICALRAYAARRGIEIVPEIDVPGHCTSFARGYGEIFGTDGIICQNEASMVSMEVLFRELCGLFPESRYIHIGGDEASIAKWTECPRCLEAYRAAGVDTEAILAKENGKRKLAELMYATFIKRMAETVISCGKTPVIWEGFGEEQNSMIPKESVIMSWENLYQPTPSLQKAGFRLVNCSWSPLYVVTPKIYWSPEEIYDWDVYSWLPVHPRSPFFRRRLELAPTDQVEGGQLLAWGDHIVSSFENVTEGVREEQRLIEQRVPALAENVWNRRKKSDYPTFSRQMEQVSKLYEDFRNNK